MDYALAFFLMFVPLILIGILFFVFWIIMLVDSANRKFKNENDKVLWILVVVLTGFIGALVYYFVVYWNDKTKNLKWFWISLLVLFVLFLIFLVLVLV